MKQSRFTVIDAMDHPYGGRILRVRSSGGDPPTLASLKGAEFRAVSPDGDERTVRVLDFPLFGGKPSDARIRKTGRFDLRVAEEGDGPPVSLTWELHSEDGSTS